MSDDIVTRLREFDADLTKEIADGEHGEGGHQWVIPFDCILQAADEIERLRAERNQLRVVIVDRALGITQDVFWDINSPTRKRCENYARSRGWHDLWDAVNEQERLFREEGKQP